MPKTSLNYAVRVDATASHCSFASKQNLSNKLFHANEDLHIEKNIHNVRNIHDHNILNCIIRWKYLSISTQGLQHCSHMS